jgi:predicted dehydrogenase
MPEKLRWGVLGVANIATAKVIPAMQRGALTRVDAIASRDLAKAKEAAAKLGIPKAYGSYEELLADRDIDAIYNPLPNHLHVPWSIKAAEAGKHVLCEKPIALTVAEARTLIEARDRAKVTIGEAFMVRTHPQWLRAREIVRSGEIGELRAVLTAFTYFNRDPKNVRNIADIGGGALMDIGCYAIQYSRFLFEQEPARALALIERDPDMHTDRLTSGMLDFPRGQGVFTVSTQLSPHQRCQILGTKGRVEVVIPCNAPPDRPMRIYVDPGPDPFGANARAIDFPVCDQYTIQGDEFTKAIRGEREVPTPLEDSIANMRVLEALFRSAKENAWVKV